MTFPINVPVLGSFLFCELINFIWNLDGMPWKPEGTRILISALVADLILAMLIDYAIRYHWGSSEWSDAFQLALYLSGVYIMLLAPYVDVTKLDMIIKLALDTLHKTIMMTGMIMIEHVLVREGY
jgi:hypothetical protein